MALLNASLIADAVLVPDDIFPVFSALVDTAPQPPEVRSVFVGNRDHTIDARSYTQAVSIHGNDDNFLGFGGDDWIYGGRGSDSIQAHSGNDKVKGGLGNDSIYGGSGDDTLYGERGNDRLNGGSDDDYLYGQQGNDYLFGSTGKDVLSGGSGDDTLLGGEGKDNLTGGYGRDVLSGGNGNDTLNGGRNNDVQTGGGGADKFIFSSVFDSFNTRGGVDTITDFSRSQGDKIDLKGIDASLAAVGDQAFVFKGAASFSGAQGELVQWQANNVTTIAGDVDGDRIADFQLNVTGNLTFASSDFLL